MENIKKIAAELRAQIQDEWTMGSPSTSRNTYKELKSQRPKEVAMNYVVTYAENICSQNTLFWRTIGTKITTLMAYYREAESYLQKESLRTPTIHVARCLQCTSLAYIMALLYHGLLQKSVTKRHIQKVQDITPEKKGLGLKIAGVDIDEYNDLLETITPTQTSTESTSNCGREETSTQSSSQKRLATIAEESETNYYEDILAMMPLLKGVTAKDSNGTTIFTRPASAYAYLAYKIKERRGYASIDWESMLKVLPTKDSFNRRTLIDAASKYATGKKKPPTGHHIIDEAIKRLI